VKGKGRGKCEGDSWGRGRVEEGGVGRGAIERRKWEERGGWARGVLGEV